MMNNYNSLGYRTGSSKLNSQEPEVVGNAPNSSGKMRTSWLMSLVMMVMLLSGLNSFAQLSSYGFASTSGTFTPLTGSTLLAGTASGDTAASAVTSIGFTFVYDGVNYTQFSASCNGWVRLGATAASTSATTPISSTGNGPAIAFFARDAKTNTTGITYKLEGTPGSQILTIEYLNYFVNWSSTTNTLSAQIKLYEGTNVVQIVYGTTAKATAYSGQVGLVGTATTNYANRTTTSNWAATTAGTANSSTVSWSASIFPASGLTYTWTPPACGAPAVNAVASIGTTTATISWNSVSAATSGYDYEVRTSGTAGSGATGLATSGSVSSGTSASLTGLTQNTSYSVYVRSNCGSGVFSNWTTATTFKTLCDAISTLPWNENFDTMGTTVGSNIYPSCWGFTNITSTNSSYNNATNAKSGANYIGGSWSFDVWFYTPSFNLVGGTSYDFSYWTRQADTVNGYTLTTTYGNGQSVAAQTNTLGTEVIVSGATYVKKTFTFTPATSGSYSFAVHNSCPTSAPNGIYFDDFNLRVSPTCYVPTGITASSVTNSTATVSWSAPATGTTPGGYEYVYSTSNVAPTGSGTSNASTTVNLIGLTSNTTYYVFVRSACGASDFSEWTTATSFKTSCDAVSTFPYNEGFESITVANTLPSCMTSSPAVASGGKVQTYIASATVTNSALVARTGSKFAAVYWSPSATAGYVFSAPLQLVAGKAYDASVFYKTDGVAWTDATIYWGTSATTGAMTNTIATVANAAATAYTEIKGSFSVPTTGVYYLAVRGYNATSSPNYIAFDDLSVTELPDCSATPNNGVAVIPSASGCSGLILNLSATGLTTGLAGISYQWQSSPDNSNWTNISGATAATYSLTTVSGLTYYRVNTTCTPTATTSSSSSVSYTGTICTYNTTRATGVAFTSIMPANGGSGLAFPGWQSTTSGDDNTSTTQALTGTTFKFQGQTVTGMQACSNGWMTFNTSNTSTAYTNDLTATGQNRVLAPFWDDLVFTAQSYANRDNSLRYQIDGTLGSGSAVITVEWAGIERYNIPGPNLNFQVKLYESDNHIEYIYGTFEGFDGSVTSAYSYSVGMNGSNPAGASTVDHFVLQTPNENHFDVTNNTNQIIMPTCNTMYSFVPGVYSGLTSAPAAAAPANDNSASASSLTVLSAPATSYCGTYYNSRNATDSGAGLPTCLTTALTAGDQDDDVWFKFTTTVATDYLIKLRSAPNYDGVIQLLDSSLTPISCQNSTGAGLIETINANGLTAGGTTYYLRVFHKGTGVGTSNGEFSLSVSEVIAPPTNDNIAGATSLSVTTNCTTTSSQYPSTLSATASPEAVSCSTPDDDVWYSFVATTTSNLITVQSGTGYNAALQVYSSSDNTATGTLTSLTCTNATGTAGVETYSGPYTIGNTYFVRVYHALAGVGSGKFTICVTSPAPACATLSAPANAATNVSITPTLTWTAATFATKYDVYLKETAAATYTLLAGDITTTSYTVTVPLLTTTQYSWYVIPKKADNDTACTTPTVRTFTTECPLLVLSSSAASYCVGGSTTTPVTITTGTSSYTSFVWAPTTGVSGNSTSGYTFNPTASTVYTLTADNGAGCTKTAAFTVTVNALPVVNFASTSITKCVEEAAVAITSLSTGSAPIGGCLTASHGQYPTGAASTATTCNGVAVTSITTAAYAGEYSNVNVSANYKYVFTSDGGSDYITIGNSTGTTVLAAGPSPLTWFSSSAATVRFYTHTDSSCGEEAVSRTRSYTCQPSIGLPTPSEWTPQAGLFTDAAGTTAYTGGLVDTVYAKPSTTTVYTSSITSAAGCPNSSNVTVTVNASVGGTAVGGSTICVNGSSDALSLTGSTGSVIRWEKSVSPFTTWTPIASSATPTYVATFMGVTTQFRAVVKSGTCAESTSTPTTVTIDSGCTSVYTTLKSTLWNATVAPNTYLTYQSVGLAPGLTITKYGVEVTNMTSNAVGTFESTATNFRLIDASPSVASYGTSFSVKVRLQVNGVWQPYGIAKVVSTAALPPTATLNTYCGGTLPIIEQVIYCTTIPLATSYTFEVTQGTSVATITNTLNNFKLTNLDYNTFPVMYNTSYSVRIKVKTMVDGNEVESAWSTPCTVTTPAAAPTVTITSGCGTVLSSNYTLVKCTLVKYATDYKFVLSSSINTLEITRPFNNFSCNLISGVIPGTLYTVAPSYKLYGQWYEGTSCDMTTPGTSPFGRSEVVTSRQQQNVSTEFAVKAYPNPFAENFKLNVTSSIEGALQVKVYDMLGKLVEAKELSLSEIETLEVGNNYPSGVYNVVVSQGEKTQSLRVIKR